MSEVIEEKEVPGPRIPGERQARATAQETNNLLKNTSFTRTALLLETISNTTCQSSTL
jgi:hypothetical protein